MAKVELKLCINRMFAETLRLDDGKVVRLSRIGMKRDHLRAFAQTMTHDHIVVEATSNAVTAVEVITPHVGRVATANPHQVRMMAHADIKADTTVLTKLHASGCLPEVWVPDPQAQARRRK